MHRGISVLKDSKKPQRKLVAVCSNYGNDKIRLTCDTQYINTVKVLF